MSFAGRLVRIFRAIISDALSDLKETLVGSASAVMQTIDERVNEFFASKLQLDTFSMLLEHE